MPELPSPPAARIRRARWLDSRLILGVLLVLGSMTLGAKVVARADDTTPVWSAAGSLSAGSVLRSSDVVVAHVHLPPTALGYVPASAPVVGRTLAHGLGSGELLPLAALVTPSEAGRVEVSVPVRAGHFPLDLARNDHVDVYVTPTPAAGGAAADGEDRPAPRRVLAAATVAQVRRSDGRLGVSSSGETGIVLALPRTAAGAPPGASSGAPTTDPVLPLVAAFGSGSIDVVRVASR